MKPFQYPSLKTITLYRSLFETNPALNKVLPASVAWLDNALVVLNSTVEDGEIEIPAMYRLIAALFGLVVAATLTHAQFFQPFVSAPLSFGSPQSLLRTVCYHEGRTDMFLSFPQDPSKPSLQHRAVVLNSEAESRLPSNLQNPFYKDPRITAALAKESWFTPGEEQVREREAEKIPRSKIYSIIKNAGFVRR
uniref:Uncharacterized protein n=1 Tax=Timema douglasi TaxID=61478 RepID=A0A7R8ZFD3_TIMDO|nr:unnamed protein product [Timema douglasi]